MLAFFRNDMGFGGNNGFTDFKDLLGFDLQSNATRSALLAVTAVALGAATGRAASCSGRAPAGAARDTGRREPHALLGYRVDAYKLWVFVLSAVLAGVAGALYVPQAGIINPSEFEPINSIEVVIWVAVGGRGTLYGAAAGAVLVNYAKDLLHQRPARAVALCARGGVHRLHALPPPGVGRTAARGGAEQMTGQRPQDSLSRRDAWREKREAALRRKPSVLSGDVLYLRNVTVSFDGFKALDDLTLHVDPGELLCVIGPNGAGKTTMMDVVTGKTRPEQGSVWYGTETNLLTLSEPEIAQFGVCRKFQKPTVFDFLTVFENLELALAGEKSFWHTVFARPDGTGPRAHRPRARDDRVGGRSAASGPARWPTGRSSG